MIYLNSRNFDIETRIKINSMKHFFLHVNNDFLYPLNLKDPDLKTVTNSVLDS